MTSWEEFRRSVTIPGRGPGRYFRPATDTDLDDFEKHAGIPLPRGYREFTKVFGACELGPLGVLIAKPRRERKRKSSSPTDLTWFADKMHKMVEASTVQIRGEAYAVDPAQSLRLVFFASDSFGDSYGWDPEDVSNLADHEYAVYSRYHDDCPYLRRASSFEEFVLDFCLGESLMRWREAGCPVGENSLDYKSGEDPRLYISPR